MGNQTKTSNLESLLAIPYFNNYDQSQIVEANPDKLRSGTTKVFNVLKWAVVIGAVFAFCKYAIPIIFTTVGYFVAMGIIGVLIFTFIMFVPTLFRWIKNLVKVFEKKRIDTFAFDELERKKVEVREHAETFGKSKVNFEMITQDLQNESTKSKQDAEEDKVLYQKTFDRAEAEKLKIEALLAKHGEDFKTEDEYIQMVIKHKKLLTECGRLKTRINQSELFVKKYGARAATLKKVCHRFEFVKLAMDEKVLDIDATIDFLKKEYNLAKKFKSATDSAHSVLGYSEDWQFEYALESINLTIENDLSSSIYKLNNIESLTKNLNLDDDTFYDELDKFADDLKTGKHVSPSDKAYKNPDYKFTSEDRANAGHFGKLM